MAANGDSRHTLGARGRTRYGNQYEPEPGLLTFGSCTASTISPEGHAAAHRLHGWTAALEPALQAQAIDDLYERVRTEIVANVAMSHAATVEVVITPSGTDAEFVPLLLSLADDRDLTTILVGAAEAGSGTANAAAALHFDPVAPSGRAVEVGAPVDERTAARVRSEHIGIRESDGSPRDESAIDDDVRRVAEAAVAADRNVLVHVIAHSKTGVHAPSLPTVHQLVAAHPGRINVVIDAAQGRFSRRGLSDSLDRGYLTMTTGSKFFGGSPFAGAVLVPASPVAGASRPPTLLMATRNRIASFPPGFSDYFTASMLPRSWRPARASLREWANVGVLVRWWAALAEIRDYYSVPARLRLEVLRHCQTTWPAAIDAARGLELTVIPPPLVENDVDRLLESKTTVFPFRCLHRDGRRFDAIELRQVQGLMRDPLPVNELAHGSDPPLEHADAALCVELGQPVLLGGTESQAVLRLAVGARQIIRACVMSTSGSTFPERLDTLTSEVERAVRKLDHIVATFDHLTHPVAR
ncbi:MAG: hypothetical protein R2695_13875 [Acidimicrobiales bacterium]